MADADTLDNIEYMLRRLDVWLAKLVDEPVEPSGILSRIEQHVAQLKAQMPLQQEMHAFDFPQLYKRLAEANDQATARHEFMRECLVAGFNDVLVVKAQLKTLC